MAFRWLSNLFWNSDCSKCCSQYYDVCFWLLYCILSQSNQLPNIYCGSYDQYLLWNNADISKRVSNFILNNLTFVHVGWTYWHSFLSALLIFMLDTFWASCIQYWSYPEILEIIRIKMFRMLSVSRFSKDDNNSLIWKIITWATHSKTQMRMDFYPRQLIMKVWTTECTPAWCTDAKKFIQIILEFLKITK